MWSALLRTTVLSGALVPVAYTQISPPDFPPLPVPITSGYTQTDLDQLWQSVEQSGIPVVKANITRVLEPLANFSVSPEPPRFRPAYLQANTSSVKLPKGFLYGVSTSATQVEGAVKEGGRGPSSWDWVCHNVPSTCSGQTPDVVVNEYYLYKQDIQRVKAMGVNTFSFSFAWSRILPFGGKGSPVSEEGLQFYDNFIDELLKNGIEPVATLFHWDTPINLMSQGGFLNRSIVEDFNNYASIVFQRYGNKVKTWITFNEPLAYCAVYSTFPFDPSQKGGASAALTPFICAPNLIEAHATAVQTYRGLVSQGKIAKGKISIKHDGQKPLPFDPDSESDRQVADRVADFFLGIFSQPIHVDGNYPQTIEDSFPPSVLRRFTDEEKAIIIGSADFYAIDAYSIAVAKTAPGGLEACISDMNNINWPICQDTDAVAQHTRVNGWPIGASADPLAPLFDTTQHMRGFFKWLSEKYPSPGGLYITEFGFAEPFEASLTELYQITWDERRANYLLDYLNEVLLAIHEDKIDLRGVFVWTPVDNFEWGSATRQKFGLLHVNFSAPGLDRTYKISFFQVRDFFREHFSN